MARPKKNADVVEDVVTPEVENTEEGTPETPDEEVVMVSEEEKAEETTSAESSDITIQSAEKNVKVKAKKDHSCCIGGVWYNLVAGKETNVPASVKQILANANLLEVM